MEGAQAVNHSSIKHIIFLSKKKKKHIFGFVIHLGRGKTLYICACNTHTHTHTIIVLCVISKIGVLWFKFRLNETQSCLQLKRKMKKKNRFKKSIGKKKFCTPWVRPKG